MSDVFETEKVAEDLAAAKAREAAEKKAALAAKIAEKATIANIMINGVLAIIVFVGMFAYLPQVFSAPTDFGPPAALIGVAIGAWFVFGRANRAWQLAKQMLVY